MTETWDEDTLKGIVGTEAGTQLEFIGGVELAEGTGRLNEVLTKEVSALANTAGGTLILGLTGPKGKKDARRGTHLDGVPNNERWSEKRIRQTIDLNLHPSLPGLKVSRVTLSAFRGKRVAIVIEVPASRRVHQAKDKLYYGRLDGQSIALHDSDLRMRMESSRTSSAHITADIRLVLSADRVRGEGFSERLVEAQARVKAARDDGEEDLQALKELLRSQTHDDSIAPDPRICFDEYITDFTVINDGEKTLREFDLVVEVVARNGCVAWEKGELRAQPLGGFPEGKLLKQNSSVYRVQWRLSNGDHRNSRRGRLFPGDSMKVGGGVNLAVPENHTPNSGDIVASWRLYHEDGFPFCGEIDLGEEIARGKTTPPSE